MPKTNKNRKNRKRKHISNVFDESEDIFGTPKSKRKLTQEEIQAEEEHLSNILFGSTRGFLQSLEEVEQQAGPSHSNVDSGVGEEDSGNEEQIHKPAWVDDDDGIEVGQALDAQRRKLPSGGINNRSNKYVDLLRHKFESSFGTPKWASMGRKREHSDSDSDEDILKTCGFIKKSAKTIAIPSNILEFKKVADLNRETYSEGPYINSIEFHQSSSVGLVAGNGGIATLFAVDGKTNSKLHSVAFERFPIISAKFLQNGNEAILGSRHSHIFVYDLLAAKSIRINLPTGLTQFKNFVVSPNSQFIAAAGKWGEVHLLTSHSKERISLLKQDSEVTALSFSSSGDLLFGHSDTGEVTVWDMNSRKVMHKFMDEGCLQGTTISTTTTNQFIATGSAQGVVNLYNMEDVLQHKLPKPRKSILNLTTSISSLKFNQSSEILALASVEIPNSVKLFHIASESVFSNFPQFGTKIGHVNALNFSPGSGYIAFGDRKSIVTLYRLKHYKNY